MKAPKIGYQDGGKTKKKTPEEWKKENESLGRLIVPYLNTTGSGSSSSKYPDYYDTTKFDIKQDPANPLTRTIIDKTTGTPYSWNSLAVGDMFSYDPSVIKDTKTTQSPLIYGNYENGKQVPFQGKPIPKKANGGVIDDPKKKVVTTNILMPNTNFPTVNQQMAEKGLINPTTANILDRTQQRTNSGGITTGAQKTLGVLDAGGLDKKPLAIIPNMQGNYDPNTGIQYGFDGKMIQAKASGGKVMKAPKGIKGYKDGDFVTKQPPQLDANGQPIVSANNQLNVNGAEFQTQGDYPLATTKLDENGKPEIPKTPSANEMKVRGVANTAGSALGGYGSGYYATKENTSTGDTVRSGGLSAVSKMGGIGGAIGGIAAIGDQIGAPIKKRNEKVNNTGNVIDEQGAKKNAIGGALFSPSKALVYRADSGNWGDVSGKGYLNYIEQPYKKQIQEEKAAANEEQFNDAMSARNKGEVGYNAINKYRPHEFAKGGKIVGAGTGKSDSINAKVEEDSFVVPAENSKIAETLRKVVLKKAPKMKADLKQKGGEDVKLSNGEHLFSPEETAKIEALGINLEELAPNANNDMEFADGGKVPEGTQLGKYYYRNGKWSDGKGNVLTKEFGQKYTDAYNKQVNSAPTKTGAELEKVGTTPSLKAPSVKKVAPKTNNGITNENYVAPQDLALLEQLKKPAETNKTVQAVNDPNLDKYNKDLKDAEGRNIETNTSSDKGKSWKAWSPMFGNVLGNAVEVGASLAQIKMGRDALNKAGERPIGQIDPTFQANVDRAQAQSKYGFSAEQNALLNQENQNATNAARFAARNYSGGSGGNAFNMERSAINDSYGRGLQAKVADQALMLNKQDTANQMSLQKAGMSRQLFDDKLGAWNQDEMAAAGLKNQGWRNIIGAGRYASALNSIQQQNKLGQ